MKRDMTDKYTRTTRVNGDCPRRHRTSSHPLTYSGSSNPIQTGRPRPWGPTPGLKHSPATYQLASYLTSRGLGFLTCKWGRQKPPHRTTVKIALVNVYKAFAQGLACGRCIMCMFAE